MSGRPRGKRGFEVSLNEALAADSRPLQDELIDMMRSGDIEEPMTASGKDEFRERILPLLDRIPPQEADALLLYFLHDKLERDIAAIFDVTQASISYRLAGGVKRIRWLLSVPAISPEGIRSELPRWGFAERDIEYLAIHWATTSVTETGRRLRLTANASRQRFYSLVRRLRAAADNDPAAERYAAYFEAVVKWPGALWAQEGNGRGGGPRAAASAAERAECTAKIKALLQAGETRFSDIAVQLGVHVQRVYKVALEMGIEPPLRRRKRRDS